MLFALDFPTIGHMVEWPAFLFEGTPFAFNKIALIAMGSTALTLALFIIAGRKAALVPTGVQNFVEASVELIRDQIVLQAMGPSGLPWMPFLTAMFFFIFFNNITEVIPGLQMPSTARMALPMFLSLLVWIIYNVVGVINQGPIGYLKSSLFPPGVPKALYILVTPIEFISTFIVRPFSLAVRLFANMLAGHILLVTFGVLTAAMWSLTPLVVVAIGGSFPMLIAMTGFEVMVSLLQAYIFTILTAVYIDGAAHPHH